MWQDADAIEKKQMQHNLDYRNRRAKLHEKGIRFGNIYRRDRIKVMDSSVYSAG